MYTGISLLYTSINSNKKERLSTILEPLQAMVQLALLSFTPIGTKLSIYENLLHIQINSWNQFIIRNYYNDKKDDLYYLFNVINRFNKFYINNNTNNEYIKLFILLNELAYNGLYNLIQTYTFKNNINIVNTLNMYKSMIKNPSLCIAYENEKLEPVIPSYNLIKNNNEIIRTDYQSDNNETIKNNEILNIDDLFINIKSLYNEYHYKLIYNFLQMIINDNDNYIIYIEGLNSLFTPINNKIKAWINTNLAC